MDGIADKVGLETTRCGSTELRWGERTYVMGIVNVSPDSFSGDGIADVGAAVAQGVRMEAEGADILDVGGESTRPGSSPVSVEEEVQRVVPVIERLVQAVSVPVSVDTYKSEVARRAVAAGARLINNVWGLQRDPEVARVAAESGVPIILMQNQRGTPFRHLVPELVRSLALSIERALACGVAWENIIIDPGVGFGKTVEENLAIVRRLGELRTLGRPILLGTSRKSFIGLTLDLPMEERLEGTAATIALGIANGADIVRVHDVTPMLRVVRMTDAILRAGA